MIIRGKRKKEEPYTKIYNSLIYDELLDWKDMGLLIYLLSHKDNWTVMPEVLAKTKKTGIKGIYAILQNLEKAGYVKKKRSMNGTVDWHIFGEPCVSGPVDNSPTPYAGNRHEAPTMLDGMQAIDLEPHTEKGDKAYPVDLTPHTEKGDEIPLITNTNKTKTKYAHAGKDFPDTSKNNNRDNPKIEKDGVPKFWNKWREYFVNEMHFSPHQASSLKSINMMKSWMDKGYKKSDVVEAINLKLETIPEASISVPHFFAGCVDDYMRKKKQTQKAAQKPDLPAYQAFKKPNPVEASTGVAEGYLAKLKKTPHRLCEAA